MRRSLRRHARAGWARVVFARPGTDEDSDIRVGPGTEQPPQPSELDALVAAAEQAVAEGRVKITLVLDERTRVRIDGRHGAAKVLELDAAKVMGGKDRPLRPDASGPLLRTIGLMNADGSISARHAKKYKQANHLVELCRPTLDRLAAGGVEAPLTVLDLACGNAYLTFVLAEALRLRELPARLHGVDVRPDVVERARARADALGWSHLSFAVDRIEDVDPVATPLGRPPDVVVALHACDTATDAALALAIRGGAQAIFCAPCCQRELSVQLHAATVAVPALARHGLLAREHAAVLTDALRVEVLDACGYDVDCVEFVASEHTPKNLLLRAHRRRPDRPVAAFDEALVAVRQRCEALGVQPSLVSLLSGSG